MSEASIPVDLFNPGQVFACLGFVEIADVLLGDVECSFDWSDRQGTRFVLRAKGSENPFAVVLDFVTSAEVHAVAPHGSINRTEKWGVPTTTLSEDEPFPFSDPGSPATLPAVLERNATDVRCASRFTIDHWGDETKRDATKFWAGAGGYPGAARVRDALGLVRGSGAAVADPFAVSAEQSSSFSFDWRRDYIPIDTGFSLNRHARIATVGYPLVELLAAMGLRDARPRRDGALEYRYGVLGLASVADKTSLYLPSQMRAALGCAALPFERRTFRMQLGWPGQEGKARCITTVTEEVTR